MITEEIRNIELGVDNNFFFRISSAVTDTLDRPQWSVAVCTSLYSLVRPEDRLTLLTVVVTTRIILVCVDNEC